MDNKKLELQAEYYIISELSKHGFYVNKPQYDIDGADLRIEKEINNKTISIVTVQSKGRSLNNGKNNSLSIPQSYVTTNFIVILYLIKENSNTNLFCFFKTDIEKWTLKNGKYLLTIPYNFEKNNIFFNNMFNNETITKINQLLLDQNDTKIKDYTSLIIDGIFLEKAIQKTKAFYQSIYPNKHFIRPDINILIELFLSYAKFEKASKRNCYLIYSKDFSLSKFVNLKEHENNNMINEDYRVLKDYKLYLSEIDQFVNFEIEDTISRLIKYENIILVADDPAYELFLKDLKSSGNEIVLIKYCEDFGTNIFSGHKWADIVYPIALSIGLKKHEI